ncbi:MAG: alpha-amylase family glycosyl hydrolase, partial [Myxococcota bacterium]
LVNASNQPPIADAGPTKFAAVGQEVQLDATWSRDPDLVGFQRYTWTVVDAPPGGQGYFRCVDEELMPRDGFGKPVLDSSGLSQGNDCGRPAGDYGAVPRFSASVPGRYVVGLTVTDYGPNGGLTSAQATTEVYVNGGFNLAVRPRVEVAVDGNTVTIDGSLTENSSNNGVFIADAENPAPLSLSNSGLRATFQKPTTPGAYVIHFTVDNAYPASAMVRVLEDGTVDGFDLARPPREWKTEKVLYLGYVREFYDSDGDGEGDLLGMIDRIAHLADLGVNAMWLMPLSPGPTTHGYATTGFYGVEEDYGTAEDVELLAETAHAFGIELVMDLVANHTSDQHPFFQAARQNPESPLRDWYAFNPDGNYRYAFTFVALPDQNQNNPLVRQGMVQIVDWFLDRGFDGIRCDIAGFTPPSFWQILRRHLKARSPDAIMLAELIPPMAEFFDDGFDLAYDSTTFWNLRDGFASGGSFDSLDGALEGATRFVQNAYSERARSSIRQEDVLFMRYIDNQDEDRFLLRASGDLRKARAVATVLLTLPGTPLITYGNEVGITELRGRYPFSLLDPVTGLFPSQTEVLRSHYRKLITIRKGNRALRIPDNAPEGENGNSYVRISSGNDEGGGNVYSYLRYGDGQRFLVLSNRADSTALGTRTRIYPPASAFADYPTGNLTLVDHLDPSVRLEVTKAQLLDAGGYTVNVPGFGSRVLQVTRFGIPDDDDDDVLDSYDNCIGVPNATQRDLDADGVGDRCDVCPGSAAGSNVGRDGCALASGADEAASRYDLDGSVDRGGYERASGQDITLYASFNGQQLYVATEAASRGEDVFVIVTDNPARTTVAPFGKAGTVATDGIFLADEGENDFTRWFGVTGEAVAFTEALPGRGVLEGTLNLVELFGEVPDTIYLAAIRYSGADGANLIAQAPAGNGDSVVSSDELFALSLAQEELVQVDAGPEGGSPGGGGNTGGGGGSPGGSTDAGTPVFVPGDADGDGVEEFVDNCAGIYNPSQADADQDGFGDACDACPLSAPSTAVDAEGCGERETSETT